MMTEEDLIPAVELRADVLRAILDSYPGLAFLKDRNNRVVCANRGLCDIMGMTEEELVATPLDELFPQYQVEKYALDDRRVILTGRPIVDMLEPMDTPIGTRWYRMNKAPYRDATGLIKGVIGFAVDVTGEVENEDKRISEIASKIAIVADEINAIEAKLRKATESNWIEEE